MGNILFFLILALIYQLLSRSAGRFPGRPSGPGGRPGPRVRVRVEPGPPGPSPPAEQPAEHKPAAVAPERPVAAALRLDRRAVLTGIIFSEVIGQPRGLRPWRPHAYRRR